SESSTTPPTPIATPTPITTVVAAPRLIAATKGKQPARATSPADPSDVERTEAEQLKIVLRRSRHETHISQQGGSSTDEGTGSKPGVSDVLSDDLEEEISWNSFDDEDVDDQTKGRNDNESENTDVSDDDDDQDEAEKVNDDDDDEEETSKINEQEGTESGEGDDEETESDGESVEEETKEEAEESFDPIPRTPEDSEDAGNGDEDQGSRISEEERMHEEEEADELYYRVKSLEVNFSEYMRTNQFPEAVSNIPGNKSIQRSDEQRNLYKALVDAYEADKTILDSYGESTILKRRREDDDDQEGPFAGSDRGSKRRREGGEHASASTPSEPTTRSAGRSTTGTQSRQMSASESAFAEELVQTTCQMEEPSHPVFKIGAEDQPIVQTSQHPEWFSQPRKPPTPDCDWNKTLSAVQGSAQSWISELAKQTDARSSFNELLDTPIDFSNFIMNWLGVNTLTPELLAGPTYELMRGSCNSLIELEYHLEEVYKATTDHLDWVHPEGQQYPHNLLQPLSLIPDNRGRRVILFEHFINNDLEYLRGGASSQKYTTSVTKTKVADYGHIKWIEDLFYVFAVNRESALDVYFKRRIIAVTDLKIMEWHNYKHLDWISVCRDDDKIYKFKEGGFRRLRLQDIEDMMLLLVQGNMSNLTFEERFAFNVSLRMFTRSIIIQRRVEDLQLRVKSYQKWLNLTKPDTYRSGLKRCEAHTAYSNPRGFIYQNKDTKNRLMRIDELHKFSNETLNDVRNALDDRLKGIRMQYFLTTIWRKGDKDRAAAMIQLIPEHFQGNKQTSDELLAGPTYELMRGSCNSLIELEYHLEEVYKATTDHLYWVHPEGQQRIIAVTDLKIMEWHNYKHLDWISVCRNDDKIYKFKEGGFRRLRLQDIEDMLLLLVQGNLSNLTFEERFAFNVSLRMFTRSIIIQRRVEDLQLRVKSYQKWLNLTKPDTYRSGLKRCEAYTAYSNPRGFIYQNKDTKNRLMRIDELHKFSNGTLNDVRNALDDRLKGIRM
nr:hypothetical protein [Tanacetum cinerariifolium]